MLYFPSTTLVISCYFEANKSNVFGTSSTKQTCLDTMVAHAAMRTSGRTIELARNAPFHTNSDAVNVDVLVERRPEVVLPVFVRRGCKSRIFSTLNPKHCASITFRYNSRVHKRCQSKVCQDEERDDSLVRRHPWVLQNVELGAERVELERPQPRAALATYGK